MGEEDKEEESVTEYPTVTEEVFKQELSYDFISYIGKEGAQEY